MPFESLDIEQITQAHINALIGVPEGRDLDFKQKIYGSLEADKKEFLADISSFANTVGGYIIIGINEEGGIATSLAPFTADADAEIQRLESIALTGLQPRIIGVRIRAIPINAGGNVLVIYIPRSWNGPHRVTAQSSNRFYMRAGTRKYEPDVEELRQLFTNGPAFTQRLRDFQYGRIAKISSEITPVPIMGGNGIMVTHIIPYSAFLSPSNFEMSRLMEAKNHFLPVRSNNMSWRINLEGVVTYSVRSDTSSTDSPAYTQVWRNGCIEAVRCRVVWDQDGTKRVSLPSQAADLIKIAINYLKGLHSLDITPPIGIFVTMMGVKNAELLISRNTMFDESHEFDRDMLFFPEIIIDSYPQDKDIPMILKSVFDQIAQAGGYEDAPAFDVNGNIARP